MNCLNKIVFIFLLLHSALSFCQNLKGTVKDSLGNPIENTAIYLWKDSEKTSLIKYTYTNGNGIFNFETKNLIPPLFLEASCVFCQNKILKISDFNNIINIILDLKEIELNEVELVSEKAMSEKNDTTFYDVKKFLNGTERKVEDLLKKLPGISVNESTGQIKFKGKNVEFVQLDGDDLFGSNYTIGTKNISIDMVENIQAIENYSVNPLLRGIEDSEKTILNLTLKKNKIDFSNDILLTNGYGNKFYTSNEITSLGVTSNLKSFGVALFRNFGTNSFDFKFDEIDTYETRFCNEEFKASKNISETNFSNQLPAKRTNLNQSLYTTFNSIFKISSKLKIKTNLNYFSDMFQMDENIESKYYENNQLILQNNISTNYFKNPKIFKIENQLTYNINNISLFQLKVNIYNEKINSGINTIQNNTLNYNSEINTNNFFIKSDIEYTLKLNDKNVIKIDNTYSYNDLPQTLFSNPGNSFDDSQFNSINKIQSNFKNKIFYTRIKYLFKLSTFKNILFVGYSDKKLPFNSNLVQNDVINLSFFNDTDYNIKTSFSEITSSYFYKEFKIRGFVSLNHYNQVLKLNDFDFFEKSNLALNYSLNASIKLSKNKIIYLIHDLENKLPSQENIFLNNVSIDNINVRKSLLTLELTQFYKYLISIKHKNINKLFLYDLNFQFTTVKNSFISNVYFQPKYISYTYFQTPKNIDSKKIDFNIERFLKPLKINLKYNIGYSLDDFYNSIGENINLIKNESKSLDTDLFILSTFNFPVNFESKIKYNNSKFITGKDFETNRESISTYFGLIVKPHKKILINTNIDYYNFNISESNTFSFLDCLFQYNPSKDLRLNINFNNILNKENFATFSNNGYSTTFYQSKLLPRHILASFSFKF